MNENLCINSTGTQLVVTARLCGPGYVDQWSSFPFPSGGEGKETEWSDRGTKKNRSEPVRIAGSAMAQAAQRYLVGSHSQDETGEPSFAALRSTTFSHTFLNNCTRN